MSRFSKDWYLVWGLRACAFVAGAITLLIAIFIVAESLPALRHVGVARFFTDSSWQPNEYADRGTFNLVPMLAGTLFIMTGSVALATPFGIAAALFCRYYAPSAIARIYRRFLELLAGIPSVVFGFWGLVVVVPIINQIHPPGQSVLAAILILGLMILPTIALMADAALANVPADYHRAAASLGLSQWATIRGVILPSAKSGLFTGVILQSGRAIGETLAVLMVAGNIPKIPTSLFEPARTLTANIALEMAYALGDHRSGLFVTGLLLFIIIVSLVACAEWISKGRIYG
ncbi:MAG: phosphate ABC transporter permease subunit PstC [Verrucomicrobiota bacterium]